MPTSSLTPSLGWALGLALAALGLTGPSLAADAVDDSAFDVTDDTTLEDLVAPIALYPDDLLAILLPASAYPLDVVQASRFADKLKQNKDLKPDPDWDESVTNLLNTPDVVQLMADNLDWTIRLGEEVAEDQGTVMEAIQTFRREVDAAGNLESDDKQKIVAEEDTIRIELSNPEVIYVPQYNPRVVVIPAPLPPIRYYPTPYPVYYYPYPPGAAFATGFFFGATTAFAFSWGAHAIHHGVHGYRGRGYRGGHNDIDINRNVDRSRNTNINVKNNQGSGNRGGGSEWKPNNKGGQRPGSKISKPQNRAGTAGYKPRTNGTRNRATTGSARKPSQKVNTGGSFNRTPSDASRNKAANRGSSSSRNRASTANRGSSSSHDRASAHRSGSSHHQSGSFSGRSSGGRYSSASSSRGRASRGGGGHRGGGGGRRR